MIPPKGFNLKYFYNDETQIIRRATASVSNYHEKLGFNVPTDKKTLINSVLGDLVTAEWDTETYGTWLDVLGIDNIKSALLKLKSGNLITEDFYNSIAKHFPKPGYGTIDILEQSYPSAYNIGFFKIPTQLTSTERAQLVEYKYVCNTSQFIYL